MDATRSCPSCGATLPEIVRTCSSCGAEVLKPCPFCLEDILAAARLCRWCKSDVTTETGEPPRILPPTPPAAAVNERGLTAIIALGLMTCGLYAFYVLHEQMRDIQAHARGKARGLEPTRDLVLGIASHFVTLGMCPFWIYYVMYVYPRAYQETCVAEEIPCRDVLTPCVLLSVMATSLLCASLVIPLWIFSVAVLQHELNQHVRLHRDLGAVPA